MPKHITKQSDDFSQWYNDVVLQAELADYSPVKGSMVIRPYGYRIWELLQHEIDRRIKDMNVDNAYFPLFIPESFLTKEAEHVEGFAPEVAWVTHGGKKELDERLAVRPTSETIMYDTFRKWVQSYRDLPLKINQWANVVRWEMRTRLFLRTLEFLWQEGHTVHASHEEASAMADEALAMYRDVMENVMGVSVVTGRKSKREQFPGALYTLTAEALMRDGKALQMGTSHHLGQHFAEAFDITFLDEGGNEQRPWQTSWGVSTRLIGGLILAHGDDQGLRLPPALAPYQVVLIPIGDKEAVLQYTTNVADDLRNNGVRVHVDNRETKTPGWKFNEWELRGAPLRAEIGAREVDDETVTFVPRGGESSSVSRSRAATWVRKALDEAQKTLLEKSQQFRDERTHDATSIKELEKAVEQGFARSIWCGQESCEEKIQNKTKATLRVIIGEGEGSCVLCEKEGKYEALFARAY